MIQVTYDEYIALCGAAKALGLPNMLARYSIDMNNWTQLSGGWNAAIGRDPMHYGNFAAMVDQEAARVAAGGMLRPVAPQQSFDQAANAFGQGVVAGFNALGSAFDAMVPIQPGTHVLVAWSDGQRYPGTVAQVAAGQYLVTMTNGQQVWVPTASVTRP